MLKRVQYDACIDVSSAPVVGDLRQVHNVAMKPDRFEWLNAERISMAHEGSEARRAWRMYRQMVGGVFITTAVLLGMLAIVGQFSRDVEGTMQLRYIAPALGILGAGSAAILWKSPIRHLSIRFAGWTLLAFAIVVLTIGLLP